MEVPQGRGIGPPCPFEVSRVGLLEGSLLDGERDVLRGEGFPRAPVHHLVELLRGRERGEAAVAVAIGTQGLECQGSDGGLIRVREVPVDGAHHSRARCGETAEQAAVAGELHDGGHQRGQVGVL
jgi:hypothetical protein